MNLEREAAAERESARSALLASLLALRSHPAEDAFEALVASTVESGTVDPLALRELRWWHRASQDEFKRHIEVLVPGVWALIEESNRAREVEFARDRAAWELAAGIAKSRPAEEPESPTSREPVDEALSAAATTTAAPTATQTTTAQTTIDHTPTAHTTTAHTPTAHTPTAQTTEVASTPADPEAAPASPGTRVTSPPAASNLFAAADASGAFAPTTSEPSGAEDVAQTLAALRRRRERYELRRTEPRPHPAVDPDSTTPSGVPTNRRLVVGLTVLSEK